MKKLLTLLALLAALTFTLTACGGSDAPAAEEPEDTVVEEVETPAEEETETPAEEESEDPAQEETDASDKEEPKTPEAEKPDAPAEQKPAAPPAQKPDAPVEEEPEAPAQNGASLSSSLSQVFLSNVGSGSINAMAEAVMADLPFAGMVMPVEPGLLMGFGNTEITGFSQGVMFGPSISSIPFLGYIFQLDAGTDGSAFCQTLKSNADLRWNICTAAEEMVAVQSGSYVFFLMCPSSLEG